MALSSGTKLGSYEILSLLGAGGMGEVYRARDTKLGRDVALKILPEAMAHDGERMARFEREAQLLAALNHSNIAAIYGFMESADHRALVMELVEGPTLADRLARGPLSLDEVLHVTRQIAEALEYAHEKGIGHRDLKPANLKMTPEGVVKILDFGLAKAFDPAAPTASAPPSAMGSSPVQNSPTITAMSTKAGMILGTAAYMSPEQAKGKPVDRRADIWAFGCVLYEMLARKQAFTGETVAEVMAAVIKEEPDWPALPAGTPTSIEKLLRRCLTKDSRQRLRDIGEARIVIEEVSSGADAGAIHELPRQPRWRALNWAAAVGLMLVIAVTAAWWLTARHIRPTANWSGQTLGGPSVAMGPRISPDGHTLAFQAMVNGLTQVAVMDTESGDWTVLTKDRSRGYVTEVNWSPDGSEIYYDREFSVPKGIYSVSRFGGDEHLVLEDAMGPKVLPDGSLLVVRVNNDRNLQLYHFWPDNGRLEALDALFPASMDLCPDVRPFRDGKEAVFFAKTREQDISDPLNHLYVIDLASGKLRRLASELDLHPPSSVGLFPMAIGADDQSVLIDLKVGDLHRIISLPREGTGPIRTLLSLTVSPWFMDVDKNGNLYLDQAERPSRVLRFPASGGTPEFLTASEALASFGELETFQLPDGRVISASVIAGRSRLTATRGGGEATFLIQTKEETSWPACRLGGGEIAFVMGPRGHRVVAEASVADGRIVRRLEGAAADSISELGASPDGTTLYYAASRTIWAIGADGGRPRRIASGNAFAVDPNGRDLIVQLVEKEGVRLLRTPVSGAPQQPIPLQGGLRIAPHTISPDAIRPDGKTVLSVAVPDSWFYGIGLLDPRSGRLGRVTLNFTGDVLGPGWQEDGRIIASGWALTVAMWRFHPATGENK